MKKTKAAEKANVAVESNNTPEVNVEDKKKFEELQKERDFLSKIQAAPPAGRIPVAHNIDEKTTIAVARDLFSKRASVTSLTTQEQIDAVKKVIDLAEDGAVWDESPELREAYRSATNSFPKGPVLTTALQIITGKIVEFPVADVPIFKVGTKIGSRFIYQNDEGFIRVNNRLPVTKAETMGEEEEADPQGQKSFLCHCPSCSTDFWSPEPHHQVHCPWCSSKIKKTGAKGSTINSKEEAITSLRSRLDRFRDLAEAAKDDLTKQLYTQRISSIEKKIQQLEVA